jgi:5-methyltetrahydropteroyltriglutamate--homocysteine methyltransferase
MPMIYEVEKFSELAKSYNSLKRLINPNEYASFTDSVVKGLKDKLSAGVDIPNYPQFRDMNEMFLEKIDGIEKTDRGYVTKGAISISADKAKISEVSVIKENSGEISDACGGPFQMKVCVTGPYTLASLFQHKTTDIYTDFGKTLSHIIESNLFCNKHVKVELLVVDEPVFGFLNDPVLDFGSIGRAELLSAWDDMLHSAQAKNVKTVLHLHNTSDNLFWDLQNLNVIESHLNDPLYKTQRTKVLLNEHDKLLKAPIANAQFDYLIAQKIRSEDPEKIGIEWEKIRKGKSDPISYLEDSKTMSLHLKKLIKFFNISCYFS